MSARTVAVLAVLCGLCSASVVTTSSGQVQGFLVNNTRVFRGIPFAAPPVGALRFKPPQPPVSWTGVRDATSFGASCIQEGSPQLGPMAAAWPSINVTDSNEDCLFINVYAPAQASGLPVMVYLHAGEFRYGSSNDLESNALSFGNGSVLLVTLNTRLSLLGFGGLESLRARDPEGSTGNYGMQDQRQGLRWVQRNIAAFGGDPHRVTIFGESSGGTSVGFHLVSNRSAGLFQRAILESPGLTQSKPWAATQANTEWAVSMLTAASSPGCAWGKQCTADSDCGAGSYCMRDSSKRAPYSCHTSMQWVHYPGLIVYRPPAALANYSSLGQAKRACAARDECFVVAQSPGSNATLLGGGVPGNLSASLVRVFNMSTAPEGTGLWLKSAHPANSEACVLAAAAQDLVAANLFPPFGDTFETDGAAPTEDGVELPQALSALARHSHLSPGVQVLAGANLDEGTEFMQLCPAIPCNASLAQLQDWAVLKFGTELGSKVPVLYSSPEQPAPVCKQQGPAQDGGQQHWVAAMRSAGDSAILCRTRELLRRALAAGSANWWYLFTATPLASINMDNIRNMGAFHGAEIPFVFGDKFELESTGERALSAAMGCYWANFAASGDPNHGACTAALRLPVWPSSGAGGDALVFSNSSIESRRGLKADVCDLFLEYP